MEMMFLGKLKKFVRNKAQPEGSIVEGWMSEELLTFCSRYLDNEIETRFNRGGRVHDDPIQSSSCLFPNVGKPIGGSTYFTLTPKEWLQAHRHVLVNCEEVDKFIEEFRTITKKKLRSRTRLSSEIEKEVHRGIVDWFMRYIMNDNSNAHSDDTCALARGPLQQARRYTAYNVNGYKFRTLQREHGMKSQNSGVFCCFGTKSYASSSDNRPMEGLVSYYGKLVDIFELNYHGRFMVTLFKCHWANTTNFRHVRKDALGFTSINFSNLIHTRVKEDDEPYIQASEAQLVYYVEDKKDEGWVTPVHLKPRDLFDMGEDAIETTYESETNQQQLALHWSEDYVEAQLSRPDVHVEFD
uniref:DUF4218 domain-containing protein n=1 Tax=Cajanus cajan TaxID=3821 RepID=A0A151ST96_CAJCA|nr:hypothetical protein KK1_004279 [Cajanus cajan]